MSLVSHAIASGIATVTFHNPPRGYMNAAQVQELDRIVDALAADDAVRVLVFTGGVPGVFIRHYDVGEILAFADFVRNNGGQEADMVAVAKSGNAISRLFDKVDRLPKPTIAAINGFAQGGGFEFALCCDLRVASKGDYRIGLPETKIGIFPGAGGTERLPRLIGEAKALELILRGRTVGPAEALALGMVHEVVNDALPRALELARELAALPSRGLADAKALVKRTADKTLEEACTESRVRFSLLARNDDEAIAAMRNFMAAGEDINRS